MREYDFIGPGEKKAFFFLLSQACLSFVRLVRKKERFRLQYKGSRLKKNAKRRISNLTYKQ